MTYQIQNGLLVQGPLQGSVTNDNAPAGAVGEYLSTLMDTVAATGTAFTCTGSSAVLTASAHSLKALQAVTVSNSGGGLPTGLSAATNYYVTKGSVAANTFSVSTTLALAFAGTAISPSGAGTGTQTVHGAATLATGTAADIAGCALNAGDYEVDVLVFPGEAASVSVTIWNVWLAQVGGSAIPSTAAAILAQGLTGNQVATATVDATNHTWSLPTVRVSLAAAGYLAVAAKATFSVGTLSPQALIHVRRAR